MSSSELDPEMTVIKSKVTVTQTEVTAPKSQFEGELKELGADLGNVGKNALKGTLKSLGGFRTFILRGNVVDLAIGIVIGAAFTTLVTSFVSNIITPVIPVSKGLNLSGLKWPLYGDKQPPIDLGAFINSIISFLIVAAILYFFVVQPVNKLMSLYHPKEAEEKATRDCPYCFQAVHINATRCPFCTSQLTTIPEKPEEKEPVLILPDSLEKLSDQLAEKIVRKATSKLEKMGEMPEGSATAKE